MTEFEHRLSLITVESMAQTAFNDFDCKDCYDYHACTKLCSTQRCIENYIKFLNSEHKDG